MSCSVIHENKMLAKISKYSISKNSKKVYELEVVQVRKWCQYGDLSFRVKLENNAIKIQTVGPISVKVIIFLQK